MIEHHNRIMPVILTCARNLDYVFKFTESFNEHTPFVDPVIVVDITTMPALDPKYLRHLLDMHPRSVLIHEKQHDMSDGDSVQDAAFFALKSGLLQMHQWEDHVLFIEDDVIFSSEFDAAVEAARYDDKMAFYTFYQPHGGYGDTGIISSNVIHSGHFYGTQCIMFPKSAARELVYNRKEIEAKYPPGYDLRWSRFLDHQGRVAYTSTKSYVQHIGVVSRLGCMGHQSTCFVP